LPQTVGGEERANKKYTRQFGEAMKLCCIWIVITNCMHLSELSTQKRVNLGLETWVGGTALASHAQGPGFGSIPSTA
jgi:hypothetical protein